MAPMRNLTEEMCLYTCCINFTIIKKDEILGSASQINKPFLKNIYQKTLMMFMIMLYKMFQISDKDFINKLI